MMVLSCLHLLSLVTLGLFFAHSACVGASYTVPRPTIRVFRPRGFEVSIPYALGMEKFTFSANVNRRISDFSDPRQIEFNKIASIPNAAGRMVVQDRVARLRPDDKIYYQVVVRMCDMDYSMSDQMFIVPADRFRQPQRFQPHSQEEDEEEERCTCLKSCPCPVNEANNLDVKCTTTTDSLSVTPLPDPSGPSTSTTQEAPKLSAEIDNCKSEIYHLVQRISSLQREVDKLNVDYTFLYSMTEKLPGWKFFKLSGKISASDDPKTVTKFVLNEKLGITPNITSAIRKDDFIVFSVDSFDIVLQILQKSEEKLAHSRNIHITIYSDE